MNRKKLTNLSVIASTLIILGLSVTAEAETKLYKWVDAQGRISYQGKPPPKDSKILSEETLVDSKSSSSSGKKKRNTSSIDVYVTTNCPSCETTIDFLKTWKVPHSVKSIEDFRDIQGILIEQTNGVTVPALFTGRALITNGTSSRDVLIKSLSKTGHVDPDELKTESAESEKTEDVQSN